jgi:hypothetical protein
MRSEFRADKRTRLLRATRYLIEYGLTIGAALLCSYWILQGRR